MRSTLVLIITFTQIASSWLCCCGVRSVNEVIAAIHSENKEPACQHCCQKKPNPPAEQKPAPKPLDPCPCGGVTLEALPPSLPTIDTLEYQILQVFADRGIDHSYQWSAVFDFSHCRDLPWMTVYDRLYTHHVLRC